MLIMSVECNASRVTWQEQRSSNSKEEKLYSRLYITSGCAHEMKTLLHHFTFFCDKLRGGKRKTQAIGCKANHKLLNIEKKTRRVDRKTKFMY